MKHARLPLVLLHGWAMTPAVWDALRAQLDATFDIVAPPLADPQGPPPGDSLAAWAEALLPKLPDDALVCGWSLGAMIALELAARHPRKVARLALIGATPRFVAGADWPHGLAADTVAGFRSGFDADPGATLKRFIALQALGDAQRRPVLAALAAALDDATTPARHAALAAGLGVLSRSDLRTTLAAVAQPVCLIHGAADALMPLAAAHGLAAQLPRATLHVFDACGHAPQLSRTADCAELLRKLADPQTDG